METLIAWGKWLAILILLSAIFMFIGFTTGKLDNAFDGFIASVVIVLFFTYIIKRRREI